MAFKQTRLPRHDPRARRNAGRFQDSDFLLAPGGGLSLDSDGRVQIDLGAGLEIDAGDLAIDAGDGIEFVSGAVAVDLADTNPGLTFVSGELAALVQGVLDIDGSGVKLNIGAGLENDGSDNLQSKTRLLSVNLADANTVANTVTETAFTTTYTVPANFLTQGKVVRLTFSGRISDTGAPTVTFRLKLGSVLLVDHATTLSGATDEHFEFKHDVVCTATGATGNLATHSVWATVAGVLVDEPKADAMVDTTAEAILTLTVQWSAADPGNSATLELFMVEALDA